MSGSIEHTAVADQRSDEAKSAEEMRIAGVAFEGVPVTGAERMRQYVEIAKRLRKERQCQS